MNKKFRLLLILLLLIAGAGFYATPYLALHDMRAALKAGDSTRLASHVNFPELKENLKLSLNNRLREVSDNKESDVYTALGASLAAAFINPLVDALVTPEGLTTLLKGQAPTPDRPQRQPAPESSDAKAEGKSSPLIRSAYRDFNHFAVSIHKSGDASDTKPVVLIFSRENLINWRLTAIELPF